MAIVGGLDVHRRQITFDCLDGATEQVRRGRIVPATRARFRSWLEQLPRPAALADEGCTGWRFIVEECQAAGIEVQLAEPADTAAADGPSAGPRPTGRMPARSANCSPTGVFPRPGFRPGRPLKMRTLLRLYKDLRDEHTAWVQRIHATLFHHGVAAPTGNLLAADHRARLASGDGLSPAAHQAVLAALRTLNALENEMAPLRRRLTAFARKQPGCATLLEHYGVGPVTAVAIWAELGNARRFSSSRQAVRHTGLDVTVYSSDTKRSPGRLARQGPPLLRWALFEAAKCVARPSAPDYAYYQQVKARCGGNRAALSVARKLVRRAHHALRALGDEALAAV